MQERNLKESTNLIFQDNVYYSGGDLVLENANYYLKGNLKIDGFLIMHNANLVVEGFLIVLSDCFYITNGSIYARSIKASCDIVIKGGGNLTTFADLYCFNIFSDGNISVGGNSDVYNVYCMNYLIDGENYSLDINADKSVYIMEYSRSQSITAPDVLLASGGDFNGGNITAYNFEFGEGAHIQNCYRRYSLK